MRKVHLVFAAIAACAGAASASNANHFYLRFVDHTAPSGLTHAHSVGNTAGLAGSVLTQQSTISGAGCGDFNNDGFQDLILLGGGGAVDSLYWNNGDGTFAHANNWIVDGTGAAVALDQHIGGGVACADYDNDGWMDIYMTSCGPSDAPIMGDHRLYKNNGNGTFTNVAAAAGVDTTSTILPTGTTPTFGDYDLDGDLDLFVCSWRVRPLIPFGNRLFRNEGNGTFTDVTQPSGLLAPRIAGFTPTFVDMNGDMYPEILIAADLHTSRYLINKTDGTFQEFTAGSGTGLDHSGMGGTVGDWDGDGDFDWYVSQVYSDATYPVNNPLWSGNKLYTNQGNHIFTEEGVAKNVDRGGWGWGTMAVDMNHDERLDIIEINGFTAFPAYIGEKAYLYLQGSGGNFFEVSFNAGLNYASNARGLVIFDCNNDGDMDMLVANNDEPFAFIENTMADPTSHYLRIFLDTSANPNLAPHGIGSRIIATTATKTQYSPHGARTTMSSQSELSTHFGLGTNTTVDITVEWTDGSVTTMPAVAGDQTITIAAP